MVQNTGYLDHVLSLRNTQKNYEHAGFLCTLQLIHIKVITIQRKLKTTLSSQVNIGDIGVFLVVSFKRNICKMATSHFD